MIILTLGSFVSQWPNLNFIIYIPRHDEYPLYIVDKKGGPAGVDSFFVPQWGGVIIHNPSPSSLNKSHLSVNMETAMPTIIITQH
jgi:phosphatidylinositol glycan class S